MGGLFTRARETADERSAFEVPVQWFGYGMLAVAVGVTAIFGGLAAAPEPALAEVSPGETMSNDILSVQAHDARVLKSIEEFSLEADDGEAIVAVTFTLTDTWTEPLGLEVDADRVDATLFGSGKDAIVGVAGLPSDVEPRFKRTNGDRGLVTLQPGLPVEVTGIWIVPEADVPAELTLTMHDARLRRGFVLISGQNRFWDPTDATSRLVLPVDGASS